MQNETILFISKAVVIGAASIVLIWDIVAIFLTKKAKLETSVSWAIWGFARHAPFVPFIAGFICGHLFWGDPNTSIVWMGGEAAALGEAVRRGLKKK